MNDFMHITGLNLCHTYSLNWLRIVENWYVEGGLLVVRNESCRRPQRYKALPNLGKIARPIFANKRKSFCLYQTNCIKYELKFAVNMD